MDANGILNVSAKDKVTGQQNQITIRGHGGLSQYEIEKMLKDAEMWRQADASRRKIVELKNECDTFIAQVEDQLKMHKVNDLVKKRL